MTLRSTAHFLVGSSNLRPCSRVLLGMSAPSSRGWSSRRRLRLLRTCVVLAALAVVLGRYVAGDTAAMPPGAPAADEPSAVVRLAFVGDVHFEGVVEERLAAGAPLLGSLAGHVQQADLAVANLETAVTERGTPAPKQFTFRGPAAGLRALAAEGVDVVSVANNHSLDFGPVGLLDTVDAVRTAGLAAAGGGRTADEAYAPVTTVVREHRIAVLAATQVLDEFAKRSWPATAERPGVASAYDVERLAQAVRQARSDHDTVVVYVHWGVERQRCPPERATDLAAALVEAGADVVVGTHAHVVGPAGYLGTAFVHYGLGNTVWYRGTGPTAETGVLLLDVRGRAVVDDTWIPARITGGAPRAAGAPTPAARDDGGCAGVRAEPGTSSSG